MEKEMSRQRRWQIKNKELGLCVQCGAKVEDGHSRCPACCQKEKNKYAELRDNGICIGCGKPSDGKVYCKQCREWYRNYYAERGVLDKAKKLRGERRASGVCTRCGSETDGRWKMCQKCREYSRKYQQARKEQQ